MLASINCDTIILLFGMMIVVANLIVVQRARREVEISFWEYARAGVPLTIRTLAAGIWMLN